MNTYHSIIGLRRQKESDFKLTKLWDSERRHLGDRYIYTVQVAKYQSNVM